MANKKQKSSQPTLNLLSDQAVGEGTPISADGLGFHMYSNVLSSVAIETPGPFTIGVFGEWGTGKTSLMRMVEENLSKEKNIITVWFNAWRYESEEQPIVPLVATIVREIERNKNFIQTLEDGGKSLLRALKAVAYGFSAKTKVKVPGFAEIEASFVAKDMIDRSENIAPDPLLDRSIFFEAFQQLSSVRIPKSTRVVVLIDDLDRCFPDKAIALLESIKLVLAQPGFIFFLGVARKVIEGYLQHRYEIEYGINGFEGYAYLDKIIQLPFHIPPHRNRMSTFWENVISRLNAADRKSFRDLVPIINLASGSNPRSAVRFVNNLLVDRAIFKTTAGDLALSEMPIAFFAISRSIEQRWPTIFSLLSRSEEICEKVVSWTSTQLPDIDSIEQPELREVAALLKADQELNGLLASNYGNHWLSEHNRRNATIDFLQEERSEVEEVETYSQSIYYDIFLSYSLEDEKAATEISNVLKNIYGLNVFDINKRSTSLPVSIQSLVETSINSSQILVALVGKSYSNSNVFYEIGLALGRNKTVIPLILPDAEIESTLLNLEHLKINEINKESLYPIYESFKKSQRDLFSEISKNLFNRSMQFKIPRK